MAFYDIKASLNTVNELPFYDLDFLDKKFKVNDFKEEWLL
jgi:hypothetical protein